MSDQQRFEDRARAIKSAKLARVVERVLAVDESITLADLEAADDEFWERVAKVAQCRPPSVRTRAVVLGLLAERMQRAS